MLTTPHNYSKLIEHWKLLSAHHQWKTTELSTDAELPIIVFENDAARSNPSGGFYLSAGVHGDECAAAWGLLRWAESLELGDWASDIPLVILPCLNPYGFIENIRNDSQGNDLNRNFQNSKHSLIKPWQSLLKGRTFDAALNLHEDYDSSGIYLYELTRNDSVGNALLKAGETIIPREANTEVDGYEMRNGLLTHGDEVRQVADEELGGWPESIWLFLECETNAFTFETPSELDLERRIDTHKRFIETAVNLPYQ